MELIYLYIKNYQNQKIHTRKIEDQDSPEGFTIKNTGFNFSDGFDCDFKIDNLEEDSGKGRLIIRNKKP